MSKVLIMYEAVKVQSAESIGLDLPSRSAPVNI